MSLRELSEGANFKLPGHGETIFTHCGDGIDEGKIFVSSLRVNGRDMNPETEVIPL